MNGKLTDAEFFATGAKDGPMVLKPDRAPLQRHSLAPGSAQEVEERGESVRDWPREGWRWDGKWSTAADVALLWNMSVIRKDAKLEHVWEVLGEPFHIARLEGGEETWYWGWDDRDGTASLDFVNGKLRDADFFATGAKAGPMVLKPDRAPSRKREDGSGGWRAPTCSPSSRSGYLDALVEVLITQQRSVSLRNWAASRDTSGLASWAALEHVEGLAKVR